jgi:hypothetical protein
MSESRFNTQTLWLSFLVGCFFIWTLAWSFNLLLGFEKSQTVNVAEVEYFPHGRLYQYKVVFVTPEGHKFSNTFSRSQYKEAAAFYPEAEVKVVTDGLFWTEVVGVQTESGTTRL